MSHELKSVDYNFMRWSILGVYVFCDTSNYDLRTTYQSEVDYLIVWLNKRYVWFDNAINAL